MKGVSTDKASHVTSKKLIWVADHLHYPIAISDLEKRVISTQVFNRLHNILQNSTVFFTYPSCRTSRFSHSLGCMHIAGLIFRNSILNASVAHRNFFFEDAIQEIRKILTTQAFTDDCTHSFDDSIDPESLKEFACHELQDPVYLSSLPGFLNDDDKQYAFIVVYQAVRLVALLHDLGHPPFSHVTEFALGEIYTHLSTLQESDSSLTTRQQQFLKIVGNYPKSNRKFHEELGLKLSSHILGELVASTRSNGKLCFDTLVIKHLTLGILKEGSTLLKALHRIVDDDLDADRLDYVPRDLSMSGIKGSLNQYDRLLASYQLVYHSPGTSKKDENSQYIVEFLPSVRALSVIEQFFQDRFNLYRYVVYHHHVTKTDGLLRQVIVTLTKRYLAEKEIEKDEKLYPYLLPKNISGLWTVLDPEKSIFPKERVFHYTQWDDAWLLSVLRTYYFYLQNQNSKNEQDLLLEVQLEEILSNKKYYHSLFKRVDSFMAVDDAFLQAVPLDFNWELIKSKLTAVPSQSESRDEKDKDSALSDNDVSGPLPVIDLYKRLTSYYNGFQEANKQKDHARLSVMRETRGFFIVALIRLLIASGRTKDGLDFASSALEALKQEFELDGVFMEVKNLKAGVTNQLHLAMDDQVISLGAVSRAADELKRNAQFFPPFYVYVYKSDKAIEEQIPILRAFLGKSLWGSFVEWLHNLSSDSQL